MIFPKTIYNCSFILEKYASAVFSFGSRLHFSNLNTLAFTISISLSWSICVLIPRPLTKPSLHDSFVNLIRQSIFAISASKSGERLQLSYKLCRSNNDSSSLPIQIRQKTRQVSIEIRGHFMNVVGY